MSSYTSATTTMMMPSASPSPLGATNAAIGGDVSSSVKESDFFGLVGPLGKKYCYLFYILSIVALFLFFISVIKLCIVDIKKIIINKTVDKNDYDGLYNSVIHVGQTGVGYLAYRLLFTMCTNSA